MTTARQTNWASLLATGVPALNNAACTAGIAAELGYFAARAPTSVAEPRNVIVPAGVLEYRDYGEFYKNGFAVDGPIVEAKANRSLTIMKYQVSEQEYARCVDAGKCKAVDAIHVHGPDFPVTGVSFDDAGLVEWGD